MIRGAWVRKMLLIWVGAAGIGGSAMGAELTKTKPVKCTYLMHDKAHKRIFFSVHGSRLQYQVSEAGNPDFVEIRDQLKAACHSKKAFSFRFDPSTNEASRFEF